MGEAKKKARKKRASAKTEAPMTMSVNLYGSEFTATGPPQLVSRAFRKAMIIAKRTWRAKQAAVVRLSKARHELECAEASLAILQDPAKKGA